MLQVTKGDLFDPAHKFFGLAQGVNAQGIMGAGIAVAFREKFPDMYEDYKKECATYGSFLPGLIHTYQEKNDGLVIYNLFSQDYPGKNGDYKMLETAAYLMRRDAEDRFGGLTAMGWDVKIGLPWIGCGIAGLARHNVLHILDRQLQDSPVRFVIVEQ